MAYSFDQVFAADPANPANIASNAAITIYQPGDPTKTPLVITDTSGGALTNPIPVNANGFGSAFMHATLDRVAWDGGGFSGFFTSYDGMKNEAVAAVAAAETAAASAAASTAAAEASAALVGAPADTAIAAAMTLPGSETNIALAGVIGAEAAEQVPPLVASAIAADETVAASAAAAVTGELSSRNVPQNVTPLESTYVKAWAAENGVVALGINADGSTHAPNLKSQDATLGTSRHLDVSSQVSGYEKAVTDQAGHLAFGIDSVTGNVIIPSIVASNFAGYDIILVAGQSNSDESDTLTAEAYSVDPLVDWWFNGKIVPLPANKGSLGPSMGRAYRRSLLISGRKVLVVPTGVGSTGFWLLSGGVQAVWDPALAVGGVRNLYQEMLDKATAALAAAGSGSKIVALAWSQGENDANHTGAEYITKFDAFVANTRTALALPNLPVLVGAMVPEHVATGINNIAQIHAAHIDTPRRIQRTAFIPGPTDLTKYGETIHYSAQGQAIRGKWFLDGLNRALFNVSTIAPEPPQNITVTRSGGTADITWAAPPSRFTAFTIETSTDSGATWTPLTLTGPVELSATLAVSSTLPLWVRGKTTNEVGTSIYSTTRKA